MKSGFTLAELLISMGLLGLIATFAIPKILQAQQNGKYNAMAKEVAATFSAAFDAYKQTGAVSATTKPSDFASYFNYVRRNTTAPMDDVQGFSTIDCTDPTVHCYELHNGGAIYMEGTSFGGTGSSNYIWIGFDPDNYYPGNTTGPYKAVEFVLYYNGRLTTKAGETGNSSDDPSWFSWN